MKKFVIDTVVCVLCLISFCLPGTDSVFAQSAPDSSAAVVSGTNSSDSSVAASPAAPAPPPHSATASIVIMEFVKEKAESSPDSAYFNILKITNHNGSLIQGVVTFSLPKGWKLISGERTNISVAPGATEYIPFRVSMARSVTGGASYLINATLYSNRSLYPTKNQTSVSKACYITVPRQTSWDVYPVQRIVFFDRYSQYTPFKLRMFNRGNGTEVVKLDFVVGSALEMYGAFGNRYTTSIELKSHCDTVVSFPVRYAPYDKSELWNRDFKKLTINITATVDTITKTSSANFKYLESTYHNRLFGNVTPLNVEFHIQNLLANSDPRMMLNAYGMILLKNNDVIDYNVRFMNFPFYGYNGADVFEKYFWRRSRMLVGYTSEKWEVKLGDVYSYSTGFFGVVGRGIGGMYKINGNHMVGGVFSAAIGTPLYSGTVFHQANIMKKITLRSSLTASADTYNRLNTFGASVQSSYTFLPGQSLTLLLASMVTQHNYTNQTFQDAQGNFITTNDPGATRAGLATQFGYQLTKKRASANLNVLFASKNFSQYYSGRLDVNGNGQYVLTKKYSLLGYTGIFLQDPHIYYRGIIYPPNKYLAGTHKVELASIMTNKITLFTGPEVEHFLFSSLKVNQITGDSVNTRFQSVSPHLTARLSYKNNASGFITPYTSIGYTFITQAEDSSITVSPLHKPKKYFFNAKAGLNVIQSNWGVNIYYYIGPRDFATQTDYYYYGRFSKSIRIMPFFQKYYFNNQMLLSSYNSYYYEVISNSERIALNARLKFFLGRDWELFLDNNLFMSSRLNEEGQKTYSRNYFMNIGVKKSFDIPQPRVKYYDLKVVCFKDINGNQRKDENEQGLSDIVISVDRPSKTDSITKRSIREPGQFSPAELVTDNFGHITYYHIPEGEFQLRVMPLVNLKDLYNINGEVQKVAVSRDTTYYIPFVQSYRVMGRIILNRDEYSSLGSISAGNVRVVATDSLGNSFPALSASDGSYLLYVPKAGDYKVVVNNVFGNNFVQQETEYIVSFNGAKEFMIDFIFNEKKRSVNVNGAATSVDTLLGRKSAPVVIVGQDTVKLVIAGADTLKDVVMVKDTMGDAGAAGVQGQQDKRAYSVPVGKGITYRIQLVSTSKRIPASQFSSRFKGIANVKEYSENGIYKYTAGSSQTVADAKKLKEKLRQQGYKDAFLVPFYKGSRVKY